MPETDTPENAADTIRVGISACLLGQEVRFDGGHKRHSYITGTLGQYFEFVPVCPEAAVGLGIPRQPIRLVKTDTGIRSLGTKDPSLDPTDDLAAYGVETAARLPDISGYILKNNSPSCGMERVRVYNEKDMPERNGRGIFAAAFMAERPLLPVEEEGRLGDPVLRENFIERVFVYKRWQGLMREGFTAGRLVDFHSDHKYMVLAHNQTAYRELGRLVAEAGNADPEELSDTYIRSLMEALRKPAKPKQHVNVLQHLLGYLKDHIDAEDRAEMVEIIEQYRQGLVPLIVPITLINHHFRRHPDPYVMRQHYLQPHPRELMLRNQI